MWTGEATDIMENIPHQKPDFFLYNYETIINNILSIFSLGRKRAEVQSRRKWGCLALKKKSILSRKGCAQTEWHWAQGDSVGKVTTLFMFYSVFLVRRRGRSSPRRPSPFHQKTFPLPPGKMVANSRRMVIWKILNGTNSSRKREGRSRLRKYWRIPPAMLGTQLSFRDDFKWRVSVWDFFQYPGQLPSSLRNLHA